MAGSFVIYPERIFRMDRPFHYQLRDGSSNVLFVGAAKRL